MNSTASRAIASTVSGVEPSDAPTPRLPKAITRRGHPAPGGESVDDAVGAGGPLGALMTGSFCRMRKAGMGGGGGILSLTGPVGGVARAGPHTIAMTTLPALARPFSAYSMASRVCSKGKTRSTTGRIAPASTSRASSRNWSPSAFMNRKE